MLLAVRQDFRIYMNRQLLDEVLLLSLWMYAFMGNRGKVPRIIPAKHSLI